MCQARIYSLYIFVSSKSLYDLYLFPTNWLLLIVIYKFTIIEFAPFSLIIKGAFVTFRKIYLCVKSDSFIFSLIPCCPLFLKKLNAQFLWYLSLSLRPNLHFCNFYKVLFLLLLFLFFSLFFKTFAHWKYDGIIHLAICYSQYCTNKYSLKFQRTHESNRNSWRYCLDVFKNSHRNVCSEVLGKVVACQHGIC